MDLIRCKANVQATTPDAFARPLLGGLFLLKRPMADMKPIQQIKTTDPLKVLGDPRRLAILRLLMRKPMTLTQLGRILEVHPARVRHHLKQLEEAGFVELTSTLVVRGFVEKYYQASAQAYFVNMAIVPESQKDRTILIFGSNDLALGLLAEQLQQIDPTVQLFSLPIGSLDGLISLRQGLCHMAACHLLDESSGEYNRDYVRHLFPGRSMKLLTFTYRQQGLLIQPGNPRQIKSIQDLAREDITLANRQPGSGTRLWLDRELSHMDIPANEVNGYDQVSNTHLLVGQAVAEGKADTGIGLLAAAQQFELEFIPLFVERFDLVIPDEATRESNLLSFLDHLQSARLRKAISDLGGYDTSHTGDILAVSG